MPLEIKVGPPQLSIHEGHTVLLTEPDGQIRWPSPKGLYFFDTRLISSWMIYANGRPWRLLNSGTPTSVTARVFLTNEGFATEAGPVERHTLSLKLSRHIDGGLHEDLDLLNYGRSLVRFNLEIALRSDFADIFEVRSGSIVRRGRITTKWLDDEERLTTTYRNKEFSRAITMQPRNHDCPAVFANGRISFEIELSAGESWHSCLLYDLLDGDERHEASQLCARHSAQSPASRRLAAWKEATLKLETDNIGFKQLFEQAIDDMASLRLPIIDGEGKNFVPAAGRPWFVALFGRDSLIACLQSNLIHPDFARGPLEVLASLQAAERDDFRDAEPGKIPHELRLGELAKLELIPQTPYYGSADATPLYLITLHETWCCRGDRELLAKHMQTAERCLRWIDEYGDRDGDGFQEYGTRSAAGLENQGWKDSGEALVYPDGSHVKGPIATCELQGYVYDAWLRMAEIYDALGSPARGQALRAKAAALFQRFNEAFWDEESSFYAFALDGEKKRVLSAASNAGQCLWSGIVPPERARKVIERLMEPDMWSGWGIRTLSSMHTAYNPYSYQNGAVWPHDNALIALGFKRYGYAEEANRIAEDLCGAGSFFDLNQIPELYAGIHRDASGFPIQYLGANVPQAWAAGSVFSLLQAILGLQPDAPNERLYVDPTLPPWLPDLTLRALRIGEQCFDICFERVSDGSTRFDVLRGDTGRVALRSLCAWSDRLRQGSGPNC
ncbi:MAG TPA: glycogen debranching N-terminal domain-containing protein [Gammaproteobacteria bacterium]|nr:glycogen debranching N-terminal domain-containing protein [Gammaproteobacteria bacterium]